MGVVNNFYYLLINSYSIKNDIYMYMYLQIPIILSVIGTILIKNFVPYEMTYWQE